MTHPANTEVRATAEDVVDRVRSVLHDLSMLEAVVSSLINHDPGDGPDAYCVSWDLNYGGPKGVDPLDIPGSLIGYEDIDTLLLRAANCRDLLNELLNVVAVRARETGVLSGD